MAKDPYDAFVHHGLDFDGYHRRVYHLLGWNGVLIEGGAAQVAEAAKFPQISAKYSKFSAKRKKDGGLFESY